MNQLAKDLLHGFLIIGCFVAALACQYAKPACLVVDLTEDVCHTFVMARPDGSKLEVRMSPQQARDFVRTGVVPAGGCK